MRTLFNARKNRPGARKCLHVHLVICCALALLTTLPHRVQAQIDTVFWFAAPDLFSGHGDRPILLRIAAFDKDARVTISQPANPDFTPINTRIAANDAAAIDLTPWADLIENKPGNTVNNKGILIRSTALISVYYDVANEFNGDMFSLKGKNALGTMFHIPFQNAWDNFHPNASFEIVATEDTTAVTVTPTRDLIGHKAGVPFQVLLHRGQSFSCEAASLSGAAHPGGTSVLADKPVAITIRDESVNPGSGGCRDTNGDQLIPDKKAGYEFIVLKGFLDVPDNFYVLATANNTHVVVDGEVVDTLNAGESYRHVLLNKTAYIKTDKPSHVYHITGFGCEVGGAVIPTITCTGSKDVRITRATSAYLTLNIVAPTAIVSSFTFNGSKAVITPDKFAPVPGTDSAWSFARVELPVDVFPIGDAALIRNTAGRFQLGFVHGDISSTCRYAYFSAFSEGDMGITSSGTTCEGTQVVLTAKSTMTNQFVWRGPNGFTATGSSVAIGNLSARNNGYYVATTVGAECQEKTDSIYIMVNTLQVKRTTATICTGEEYILPSGRVIRGAGEFRDTLRYASGCDSLIRIYTVMLKPRPALSVSKAGDVNCEIGTVQLFAKGNGMVRWSPEATLSNPIVNNPIARPSGPTLYKVTLTGSDGCTATDSIQVALTKDYQTSGHSVPTAFTPNGDGRNDCFGVQHWGWVKNYSMQVYNRWGNLVFQSNDPGQCWDGTFKGKQQASEVFVYVIRAVTGCGPVVRNGTVALIR